MAVIVDQRLLKSNDAARYLAVSRGHLYALTKKGVIPSLFVAGVRRWDVLELDRIVDKWVAERDSN